MKIALKKENKNPKVNLDKYFSNEKPTNDPKLVGEWEFLSDYDLKIKEFNKKKEYSAILLSKNGAFAFTGLTTPIPNMNRITMRWHCQDKNLYIVINEFEVNKGKYTLNGDTLTTSGERHISKYLKKK